MLKSNYLVDVQGQSIEYLGDGVVTHVVTDTGSILKFNSDAFTSIKDAVIEDNKLNVQKSIKQLEGLKKRKSTEEFKATVDFKFGSFVFSHYEEILERIVDEKGDFDSALAFRFIYLCTFIDYDNKLMWGNKFRGSYTDRMTEKDLNEVLGLSKNLITATKNKLLKLGLLIIDENNYLSVDMKTCHKGTNKNKLKGQSIRVFENGIQELYKKAVPSEHKRLGYFIVLLPYVNIEHNLLCSNPEEKYPFRIYPITINEISTILGQNKKNCRRLENELLKITLAGKPVLMKHIKFNSSFYSVNPMVFYKGSDLDSLKALITLFEI